MHEDYYERSELNFVTEHYIVETRIKQTDRFYATRIFLGNGYLVYMFTTESKLNAELKHLTVIETICDYVYSSSNFKWHNSLWAFIQWKLNT